MKKIKETDEKKGAIAAVKKVHTAPALAEKKHPEKTAGEKTPHPIEEKKENKHAEGDGHKPHAENETHKKQAEAHKESAAHSAPPKNPKTKEHLQSEINIGMIGHVDHGKCIALDSTVLLNSELSDGTNLLRQANASGAPIKVSESETIFDKINLKAFSLSPAFELNSVPAKLFTQNYAGPMFHVETKRGKRITISPKHPLLVNDGKELMWVEGQNLNVGNAIATLTSIPDQEFVKDPSPNWKEKLAEECWIVTKEDYTQLKSKTKSFSEFDELSFDEINKLRILSGNSFGQMEKELGLSAGELSVALRNKRITEKKQQSIQAWLKKTAFEEPVYVVINFKGKSQSFCKINTPDHLSDKMLKFLAFVIAEGCIHFASVRFSQGTNNLLEEMGVFCNELFSQTPAFYAPYDYQISNKALACFLDVRYGIKHGNSRESGIPEWIFSLPKRKLAVFLSQFFSLEGNFDTKSSQIALSQANKKSALVLSYSLKKFGIKHSIHEIEKCATNSVHKIKRLYWQITISGTANIKRFRDEIGTLLPHKSKALDKLCQKKGNGKESDEMIPLDFKFFSKLVGALGWKKKHYSHRTQKLRTQAWFYAYNDCIRKSAISRKNLDIFILAAKERINTLNNLQVIFGTIKQSMAELGISQQELAKSTGLTPKIIWRALSKPRKREADALIEGLRKIIADRANFAESILRKISENSPSTIEWDKIKSLKKIDYSGQIIDLQVPGYHNFIAGVGGIVSHNTSLTKALTGKWCDTHSEEMKRGISIRLGYADVTFYKLKTSSGIVYNNKPEYGGEAAEVLGTRNVSFVDAPGHETLMTTMLSGAALMHGAVLVIAANEPCPQPRTIEHLMALKFAGVEKVVVAQNKVDLVTKEKAMENYKAIRNFLDNYGYKDAPIVPTVANFNVNIDSLIAAIETHIPTPHFDSTKPLKMFVARSFDINKPGTHIKDLKGAIIGGSIAQGTVAVGDEVELAPGLEGFTKTKVLSISTDEGLIQSARPGGLIAIGTDLDPSMGQNDRLRGQIAAKVGTLPKPVKELTLKVTMFERMLEQNAKEKTVIKVTDALVVTIGTNTTIGFVKKADLKKCILNLKNEVIAEKNEKVALSKNLGGQWRLIAYGEVL